MQHLVVVVRVLKAHLLEPDLAGAGLQWHCVRCVLDGQTARQNDHQIHQPVKQAGGGVEGTHSVVAKGLDLLKGAVALGKLFPLLVLGGKGLDHALSQQAVLDGGVQLADLDALLTEACPQTSVQVHRHHAHQRHTGKHCQGQRDACTAQNDKGRHDLDARDKEFLRAVVGELSHIKQIVGDAPHDGAHLGVVVVRCPPSG